MTVAIATRDRRALIVGLATIATLVVGLRALPVWWRWRSDTRAAAAEAIAQQRRVSAIVADFSHSLDSLGARVGRLKNMGPAFLIGATPAEASTMLAAIVGDIARSSLVRIDAIATSVDTTGPRELTMPRVRIEVQATGDVAGLAALLQGLEKGPTLLAVQRLSIQPAAVDGPANQVESLSIKLTVEGLVLVR